MGRAYLSHGGHQRCSVGALGARGLDVIIKSSELTFNVYMSKVHMHRRLNHQLILTFDCFTVITVFTGSGDSIGNSPGSKLTSIN